MVALFYALNNVVEQVKNEVANFLYCLLKVTMNFINHLERACQQYPALVFRTSVGILCPPPSSSSENKTK